MPIRARSPRLNPANPIQRLAAAGVLLTASVTGIVASAAPALAATCPSGTVGNSVTWGAAGGVVWDDAIQDTGLSHTYALGSSGVNMTLEITDPFQRNEDANNPLVSLPTADGNWDGPLYTKTDGVFGAGYLTWVINSTDDDEVVNFELSYDRPVLIPDFSIGDIDYLGVDYDLATNANPHDSFQDEVTLTATRNGTPVGFSGTTGTATRPVITVDDAANGVFAVAGGPYNTGASGGGNLAPTDAAGTVTLATLAPVTSIVFGYSNGPDDKAAEVAKLASIGGQWPSANWAAPLTGYETGVSNNHAVRINQFTVCVGVMEIGNNVWADVDGDGSKDVGEPNLAGVSVDLVGADGIVLDTTTTDASGNYLFSDLPPWDYSVVVTPPAGYTGSHDVDGGGDNEAAVTLTTSDRLDVDFGLEPPAGTVDGTVFNDFDNDGIYDAPDGDSFIAGVQVDLVGTDLAGNSVSLTTTTDAAGYYQFTDVPAGTYTVTESQPTGFEDGVDTAGTNATSSADDEFGVTLGLGESSLGNDFAEQGSASLAGTVVVDDNNDGVADVGETGISGVTMTLTGTDSFGNAVSLTTTTDVDGNYLFDSLRPGDYAVSEGATPGFLDGEQNIGSVGGTEADDVLSAITLAIDTDATDYDFGELAGGSISGTVVDDGGNGIVNTTITLTGTDDLGAAVSVTTTTDGNGDYSFTDLRPGTYTVTETQPTGYGDGGEVAGSLGGTVTDDQVAGIVLTSGDASINNDFDETSSSIAGTVVDDGGNGIINTTITLTGTNALGAAVNLTTTTDGNGDYSFSGLLSGTYTVTETQPTGYGDGGEDAGSELGTVADDEISAITLPVGTAAINYDFDETRSSIRGTVVVDENADGIADGSETGIGSVTITLTGTDDLGNAVNLTTTTDGNGDYSFSGLLSGTYTVTEGATPGYIDGDQTPGSAGGTEADDEISAIALPAGTDAVDYDFGETLPGAISGTVVDDGGSGIPNTAITLTGTDTYGNAVSVATTTDGAGDYVFGNLAPGTYTVNESQPTGYGDGGETVGSLGGSATDDQIAGIVLGSGGSSIDNDFDETRGSIAGTVFEDHNNDGVQDVGDDGIAGVTVTLTGTDDLGNAVSLSTTTDVDGNYSFDDLISGTYTVNEAQPGSHLDGIDSAGTSAGDDAAVNDEISAIVLAPGVNATGYDFAEVRGASIAGTVFEDHDNDGVQDGTDDGVAGVTVTLSGTDDLGAAVNLTTTTDGNGDYSFDTLRPGDYTVTEAQPSGYLDGIDSAGTSGGDDASANDQVSAISLAAGIDATGYDFGELGASSIAGTVFEDHNNDGLQDVGDDGIAGVTVALTGTDDLGAGVSLTTTTDVDGNYRFDGLRPGDYTVNEAQPASHLDGIDTAGTSAGDDAAVNDEVSAIALDAFTDATGYDFGELGFSSIAGSVVDDGGNGIANTTITLTGTDDLGAVVSLTTTTDGNGDYSFDGLRPGTYTVNESQPTGYGDGGEDAGSLGGTVTDDQIADIALPAFTDSIDNDFDETRGSIAGSVFEDHNNDGLQDVGDDGIAGVTVTLTGTDDLGNAVSLSTTTDVDGNYSFDDLISGTYTVNEAQP
ncbi:MAG: SdrD B-like domain-containing protein, partial [Acidimicrobiales bacterium]